MRIALKVDTDTLRGTLVGVPALLELFHRHGVRATFLFSLGPDHTGRALRRALRPGFLAKVGRTSVLDHYGLRTLLYGTLLPGPHIGRRAGQAMRAAAAAGHEVGIHCYDHVRWQDYVARRGREWTRRELERAMAGFQDVFGQPATVHGAAGWQINAHTLSLEQDLGLCYASDCRGTHPFLPAMDGLVSACPQLPTTLPTLDEIIGRDGVTPENAHERILKESRLPLPHGHVYTLHAELEGMKLAPVLERLLLGWREAGFSIGPMAATGEDLEPSGLPVHRMVWGTVRGRSRPLAMQGGRVSAGHGEETTRNAKGA